MLSFSPLAYQTLFRCFLKGPAERAFVKLSTNIDKLGIYLIPNSLSSISPHIWWCIMLIYLVRFWLFGFFVKVKLVLLLPSIFILLTTYSESSLFRKHLIYIPSFAPWLIATYWALDIDVNTVCYCSFEEEAISCDGFFVFKISSVVTVGVAYYSQ